MRKIEDVLASCQSRTQPFRVPGNPFRLRCTFEPATENQDRPTSGDPAEFPADLTTLWGIASSAELFVDQDHGQWGLRILSSTDSHRRTEAARKERPMEFRRGDVVLGEFLGDQDLLVVTEKGDVFIALPLDPRADWYKAAPDVASFLDRYEAADGAKYWEAT